MPCPLPAGFHTEPFAAAPTTAIRSGGGQREEASGVLEQHHGLRRQRPRERNVLARGHVLAVPVLAVRRATLRRVLQLCAVDRSQDSLHGLVHSLWRRPGRNVGLGEVLPSAWHLLVQAPVDPCPVSRPPVGLHEALEAHLLLEHGFELVLIAARVGPAHLVVAAHGSVDPSVHGRLERRVVQLPLRLLVDLRRLAIPVRLLLVEHPVLHDCDDALRLDALYVAAYQLRTQVRVLAGQVLEVPPIPRDSMDVDRRPKDPIGAF
eukprot:CAMPEP_0115604542 /NCGR_PEP_ID=MMETSP0272-20121206/16998_1 /TAXON_ID=71861 /ORGANISM="Scrippsiella trochoidea, Strain CCMP3099" /LENGTH=262 /DNA_ID=CAMNT_0003040101 /DNA_START=29 /DNA_END=814 /DNA_ORIENTATION=-